MSCTIFYKGRLIKKYSVEDFFNAVIKNIDSTEWKYQIENDTLIIDFNDGESEMLVLSPKGEKRKIDGFCKLFFENKEDYIRVFDLFLSIKNMIYLFDFSDDFGMWDDYLAEKNPCEIKLRELIADEENFVKRFGNVELSSNLLLGIIGSDVKKNQTDKVTYQYLVDNINPNIMNYNEVFIGDEMFEMDFILETWIYDTMTYRNYGRVCDIPKDTRGLQTSISAFEFGICETIFGFFGGNTGAKQSQIRKLYIECLRKKMDIEHNGIIMFRFVLSVLDYLGFKRVGRKK